MNTETVPCPSEVVDDFLRGHLSDDELISVESHLDQCTSCRSRLDAAVATDDEWAELRNSLSTDGPASTLVVDRERTVGRSEDLAFYRGMLSPSDDPQMMGRIGTYEVVGLLGHGGMGVVFKAMDPALNRYVAVKMLAPHFAASGTARQRFSREAQAAAAVVHEHVVAIHSVSQWQDTPYLVMPYIRATTLQKRLDEDGALQLREILRIGYQVASALAAAHAQGLIHRDVKPANILLEHDVERVVLTDFGLARAVDDIRLTRTDTLVGTPQYMSPEQTNDQSLDFRTDLFSLGSVLYEACTGRPAFQAVTSYGVLRKISDTEPRAISDLNPDIPDWLVGIVARLMAKEPDGRFESASEVADLLQRCLSHVEQPQLTPLPVECSGPESTSLLSNRNKIMIASVLSGVLAVAGMLFVAPNNEPEAQPNGNGAAETVAATVLATAQPGNSKEDYETAAQAYQVGAAFASTRDYKRARKPLEAAVKLAGDDIAMKMKASQTLIPAYRMLPDFEPFRDTAEFIIDNHYHGAAQSNMRTSLLSFARNRGQMDSLVKRYEKLLKKDERHWLAVFMLSEIYAGGPIARSRHENAEKAIRTLETLAELDAERAKDPKRNWSRVPDSALTNPAKPAQLKEKLAQQYAKLNQHSQAAKLFEEAAGLYKPMQAWNLKSAAASALKGGDTKAALRLAMAAEKAPEDARGDQMLHHFHRALGDTFMALDRPEKAIPHYETAIKKTSIAGYVKDTTASLEDAKKKARD